MKIHSIAVWAVSILFCGLGMLVEAQQPVGQPVSQGFPGTRMATATQMHLDASVQAVANLTGPFWVVPNPQSPQCQVFIEKGLIFMGYPKAASKEAASFIVEYTFNASISPRQRLETVFFMSVILNDKAKTKLWAGKASCTSNTIYHPNGFASSLIACDLNYINKNAKKTVGIREVLSLHSAMTR